MFAIELQAVYLRGTTYLQTPLFGIIPVVTLFAVCTGAVVGLHTVYIHCTYTVSQKNAPTLASCSFNKHGLILIIFGKQHQHTFRNDVHIPTFLVASLLLTLFAFK